MNANFPKIPRGIIPILVLVGLCVVGVVLFRGIGSGLGGLLGGGEPREVPVTGQDARLGRLFAASSVDRNGCPVTTDDTFRADEPIFFGADESDITEGTRMFARLYRDGRAVEDTQPITAGRDMRSCVWFQFDPGPRGFEPGRYSAELFVNGGSAGQLPIQIGGGSAGSAAEIGQVFAASRLDANGCAQDDVSEFRYDETVYFSADESYLPAGTQVYARLLQDGRPVEDTSPITAQEDTQSCVWFSFDPPSQGWEAGNYEMQLYVDGRESGRAAFTVR